MLEHRSVVAADVREGDILLDWDACVVGEADPCVNGDRRVRVVVGRITPTTLRLCSHRLHTVRRQVSD
jgi:hypothetical protein